MASRLRASKCPGLLIEQPTVQMLCLVETALLMQVCRFAQQIFQLMAALIRPYPSTTDTSTKHGSCALQRGKRQHVQLTAAQGGSPV